MSSREMLSAQISAEIGQLTIDLALDTEQGVLVIVGPNGAGKSSLLALILGALPVTRGRIAVGEAVLFDSTRAIDVPLEQRRLGYVPQDYGLFPHLSVQKNIEFALSSSRLGKDRARSAARCAAVFRELGLDAIAERKPHTLSGGEKQRVALARALSVEPRALLLDEPLAALDVGSRREVRGFLARYLTELRIPTLVVTHDAADAKALGQRIAVLEAGKITQTGTFEELSARPASRFVEQLIAGDR